MFKSMLFAPGFLPITALAAHSADAIGFRETEIDQGGTRPLYISMRYPTDDDDKTEVVGENRAFFGTPAYSGCQTSVHGATHLPAPAKRRALRFGNETYAVNS